MNITRNHVAIIAATILAFTLGYVATTTHKKNDIVNETFTIKPQQLAGLDGRKFKAIIFDMDGTTIDTDHIWKSSNAPILDSHAPHLTQAEKDEIVSTFPNLTIYEIWKLVHGNCSVEISADEIVRENIKHLHTAYETHGINFIPHFPEFHEKVTALGLKTAIATSSEQPTVDVILKAIPLDDYFGEHIYNADHVGRVYKPAPDIYLHAAQQLEVAPCDCIAIEDSSGGIKSAKAAGMYCIGINTGKNLLALQQADLIVDCYTQINLEQLLTAE